MSSISKEVSCIAEQFSIADWNPLIPMDQRTDFNGSSVLSSYNIRIPSIPGNNSSKPSAFNNKSFPEIVSSFGLSESNQTASALCPSNFPSHHTHGIEKIMKGKKRKSLLEVQIFEAEHQKDVSPESIKSPRKSDERKQNSEVNPGVDAQKPTLEGDASKEDFIHIRAKRGHATNSHSLAERVRREKISERMRVLQDLVPGCNKITGKAVMLDEIINYVQSLQRQVEFLSMKLSTVNPELNFDIEQILSKDIFHSQDGSSAVLGLASGMRTPHSHLNVHELLQSEMGMCNIPQASPMAQIASLWDDELQNVMQMGFIPNPPPSGSELNGSMSMEL